MHAGKLNALVCFLQHVGIDCVIIYQLYGASACVKRLLTPMDSVDALVFEAERIV